MATKKTGASKAAPKPQVEDIVVEQEIITAPDPVVIEPKKSEWEYKDRTYYLISNKQPIVMTLPSRHTRKRSLLWFDPDKGYQRELRYATNQPSVFVDEQEGPSTLDHIIFRNGTLTVPKEKQNLQKLLSLYHPLKDKLYSEFNAVQEAEDELDLIELELDALNLARELDIEMLEAILRVDQGSSVKNMTSKEIKRDALIYAKRSPRTFISLAQDENVQLRNFGVKAVEQKFIILSQDQRTFTWASTGRKLMTVPFDENPYSALAAWFKTDEGVEVFQNLQKRLK
jgi:hypothetical protein